MPIVLGDLFPEIFSHRAGHFSARAEATEVFEPESHLAAHGNKAHIPDY